MPHSTIQYPGFGAIRAECELFTNDDGSVAVAVEVPQNQTTSVTNAVEQVHVRAQRFLGRSDFAFYTVAPFDPFEDWGVFRIDFDHEGSPQWIRVRDHSRPATLAEAMDWAQQIWAGARRQRY